VIATSYRYIVQRVGVRSGFPIVEGTRIGVHDVVAMTKTGASVDEVVASFRKPRKADARSHAAGSALRKVIPIIVAQQIVQDQGARSVNVPIEAHILAVADAYQKMIRGADGKVLTPEQAEQEIVAGSGQRFHSGVVDAFAKAYGGRAQAARAGA